MMNVSKFLVDRDQTGREVVTYPETGKVYFVEYMGNGHSNWGDIDPATKKLTGDYGSKYIGSIREENSMIIADNGFDNIVEGKGSPYHTIDQMHELWKLDNGY